MLRFDLSQLLLGMASVSSRIEDLVFTVGRPPLVRIDGEIRPVKMGSLDRLAPFHTEMVVLHLLSAAPQAAARLRERGAASFIYPIPGKSRFRASIFSQRGSFGAVLRAIADGVPTLADLGLVKEFEDVLEERAGIILVNGPAGSGRSTTMAAVLNELNQTRACHIVTVEDPIEFLHRHARAVVHQREVGQDTPSAAAGLEDALYQGAQVIVLSEVTDRDAAALALEAAEAGHLVVTSVRGLDTGTALERFVGFFEGEEQERACRHLTFSLKLCVTQRLVPKIGGGRVLAAEIWRSLPTTRELLQNGQLASQVIADLLRDASAFGCCPLDLSLERLVREGGVEAGAALAEAVAPRQLELRLMGLEGMS